MQPTGARQILIAHVKQNRNNKALRAELAAAVLEQVRIERIRRIETIRAYGEDTADNNAKVARRMMAPNYSQTLRTILGLN